MELSLWNQGAAGRLETKFGLNRAWQGHSKSKLCGGYTAKTPHQLKGNWTWDGLHLGMAVHGDRLEPKRVISLRDQGQRNRGTV